MSIKAQLKLDLTEAIRSRNEIVSGTIRMVLTAITNEEVAGKEARQLSEDEVIAVLSREAKKRREAAEAFADAGRADKARNSVYITNYANNLGNFIYISHGFNSS